MALRTKLLDTEKQWLVDLTKQNIAAAGWDRAAGIKATQDQMKAVQWNGTNAFEQAQTMYQNEKKGNVWITPPITTTFGGWEVKPFTWTPEAQRVDNVMPTETPKIEATTTETTPTNVIPPKQVTTDFAAPTTQEKTTTITPEWKTEVITEKTAPTGITKETKWENTDKTLWTLEQMVEARWGTVATQKDWKITAQIGDKTYEWSIENWVPIKREVTQDLTQVKAGDIYSQLLVNPGFDTSKYNQTEVLRAKQRISNYNSYKWLTASQYSELIKQGKILPNTELYNDLIQDPVTAQAIKQAQVINSVNTSINPAEVANNTEVTQSNEILNKNLTVKNALEDGTLTGEEYSQLTTTPEIKAKTTEMEEVRDEYIRLKNEYDAIEDEVDKELEWTWATTWYKAALVAKRRKDMYKWLSLAQSRYEAVMWDLSTMKTEATSLLNTNLELYQAQKAREEKIADRDEERKYQEELTAKNLEQAYQYQYGDLNSTNPTLQNIAIERAVADMYTKYPIPGMESQAIKVQKVKDLMANNNMTWTQAITQVENEIRNSQRYKDYLASEQSKLKWTSEKPIIQNFGTSDKPDYRQYNSSTWKWDTISWIGAWDLTPWSKVTPTGVYDEFMIGNKKIKMDTVASWSFIQAMNEMPASTIIGSQQFRTPEEQAKLKAEWKSLTLDSNHMKWLAVDIYWWEDKDGNLLPPTEEQIAIMNKNGWYQDPNIVSWDAGHFEYLWVQQQTEYTDSQIADLAYLTELQEKNPSDARKAIKELWYTDKDIANYKAWNMPLTDKQKQSSLAVMEDIEDLVKNYDWNDATWFHLWMPVIAGTDRADTIQKVDQLVSKMTLPNLWSLKWPMSDKDLAFITKASSNLSVELSDKQFGKNLIQAYNVAARRAWKPEIEKLSDIKKQVTTQNTWAWSTTMGWRIKK